MHDTYANFHALKLAEPATAFGILSRDSGSSVLVAAPHGGGIEPGTSEIACAIAGDVLSYYMFEGLKPKGNKALHITSSNFDEPTGLALMRSAAIVLTVHGEDSEDEVVYLGGLHTLANSTLSSLLERHGYKVREHANPMLQGTSKKNICNLGRQGAGVQLELSAGLRSTFFGSLTRVGRGKPTAKLFEFSGLVGQIMREIAP